MKAFMLSILLASTVSGFACTDTRDKPAFLTAKIDCGNLWNNVLDPQIIVKGKKFPLAILRSDPTGICPAGEKVCDQTGRNWKIRTHAICKSYGFKKSLRTKDYGVFRNFGTVAVMKLKNNILTPSLIKYDVDKYAVVKKINCLPEH